MNVKRFEDELRKLMSDMALDNTEMLRQLIHQRDWDTLRAKVSEGAFIVNGRDATPTEIREYLLTLISDPEENKRLAVERIENTEWALVRNIHTGSVVYVTRLLVARFAKDFAVTEDEVATQLMQVAQEQIEFLKSQGETDFGQVETLVAKKVPLHTLLVDGKVFLSDEPFYPYEVPTAAYDGQNRMCGGTV